VFQEVTRTQTDMPAGCDCTAVILGKITPPQCRLYGTACKPANPIGPCMVSEEGSCRIWWSSGVTTQQRRA
jgi:hydrogenase expression/formation protein HypD